MDKSFAQDELGKSYPGAFSAVDIYATLSLPDGKKIRLATLSALTISTHRDAFPVTTTGYVAPRGFTRGHRVTAGTLLFHTLDRAAFGQDSGVQHGDQLPLFDIYLTYVNESGMFSVESVLGVVLLDMGKSVSLESLHPMEQYSYMALDYQPLRSGYSGESLPLKLAPTQSQKRAPRVFGSNGAGSSYDLTDGQALEPDLAARLNPAEG